MSDFVKGVFLFIFKFSFFLCIPLELFALPATSQKIMISSESSGAVLAGKSIAKIGGNVVDVAIASALAMSVELPQSASLGGGGFALIKMGDKVEALDYREVAPQATSPQFYQDKSKRASIDGANAIGVPGVVAGLYELHQKYGKLKWKQLFRPALDIAKTGFVVSTEMYRIINENAARLSSSGRWLLMRKKEAKKAGDLIKHRGMYLALSQICKQGRDGFYKGRVAKDIIDTIKSLGGVMTLEDLSSYQVRWLKPMTTNYRGYQVYTMPLPSTGGVVLLSALHLSQMLELSRHSPFSSMENSFYWRNFSARF